MREVKLEPGWLLRDVHKAVKRLKEWSRPRMVKFDPTKPVQTRDGKKVRIICTDRKHEGFPLVALVEVVENHEAIVAYYEDGRYIRTGPGHKEDLVNV